VMQVQGFRADRVPGAKDGGRHLDTLMPASSMHEFLGKRTGELVDVREVDRVPFSLFVVERIDDPNDPLNPVANALRKGIRFQRKFVTDHGAVKQLHEVERVADLGRVADQTDQVVFEEIKLIQKDGVPSVFILQSGEVECLPTVEEAVEGFLQGHEQ